MTMHEIETSRLRLRRFVAQDADAYDDIRRRPAVARFLPSFRGADDAEIRARTLATMASFQQHWSEHGYGPWAAIDTERARLVGHCGLRFLPEHGETEILYAFDDAVWGRGLATEGAIAARDYGFAVLKLPRLIALLVPENRGSMRVVEKLGMRPDGSSTFLGNPVLRYALERPAA